MCSSIGRAALCRRAGSGIETHHVRYLVWQQDGLRHRKPYVGRTTLNEVLSVGVKLPEAGFASWVSLPKQVPVWLCSSEEECHPVTVEVAVS